MSHYCKRCARCAGNSATLTSKHRAHEGVLTVDQETKFGM